LPLLVLAPLAFGFGARISIPTMVRVMVERVEPNRLGLVGGRLDSTLKMGSALHVAVLGGGVFNVLGTRTDPATVTHSFAITLLAIAACHIAGAVLPAGLGPRRQFHRQCIALSGDYSPHRLRATVIMATFTGAPVGGFLGGQIVALLLGRFGWPMIFIVGGVFPLMLVVALALWLPESPRFLAARQNLSAHQAAVLRRLDIAPARRDVVDIARGTRYGWYLVRAMRCRPRCCGSSTSAAC
jgi:hypothetical protein